MRLPPSRGRSARPHAVSASGIADTSWRFASQALAATLTVLALALGWRGSDFPAQLFRAELFRRHGLVVWNNLWYGGHTTLSYGLLTPLLGALTSPLLLGAVSCLVAADLFCRILRDEFPATWRLGALVFASAAVVNLIVGRVAFACGLALGLAAVRSLQFERTRSAALFGFAASAASPVAGAFVALAVVVWGSSRHDYRRRAALVVAVTAAPILVATVLYPGGGPFPFRAGGLAGDLFVSALVGALAWRSRRRTLVVASALYGLACVGAFVVPTPMGANVSRLGQFMVPPLVAAMVAHRRRLFVAALVVPLVIWQWTPALDGALRAPKDPSTHRAYYAPLVGYLKAHAGPVSRTEIPFTLRHWETTYVANDLPLARGWERQVDRARNPEFYDGTLNGASYHQWLIDNGVDYVALADAPLDYSSKTERSVLDAGVPGLESVWHDAHWRVWRVVDSHGLLDGPATITELGATNVKLHVDAPGDLLVRVHWTGHWKLDGAGCVRRSADGWTEVVGAHVGSLVLDQGLTGTVCPEQ